MEEDISVLVSFDIDGTLVAKKGKSPSKMLAMKEIFGIEKDPAEFLNHNLSGSTDS